MRTIKELDIPQDGDDLKFPDGQIRNESISEAGTPVVREIYGDILTNIYNLLSYVGILPTQTEDADDSQYQVVDALKVFSNELNDLQQIVTVTGPAITVNFDFDNLPENYIFTGKLTDAALSTETYTITGSGAASYPISVVDNIDASSVVSIVLNSTQSAMIGLTLSVQPIDESAVVTTAFGPPIGHNGSSTLLYYSDGHIMSDFPASFPIEQTIRDFLVSGDEDIAQTLLLKGRLICLVQNSVSSDYRLFCFDENDLTTVLGEITGATISVVSDNQPYMYSDGEFLYFSNSAADVNFSANDYDFGSFIFDETLLTLASKNFFSVEVNFEKTTNAFMTSPLDSIFTMTGGFLYRYDFLDGPPTRTLLGTFPATNGVVFKFNGFTYYTSGSSAVKWNF